MVSKMLKLPKTKDFLKKKKDSNAKPCCYEHKCSTMRKILKGKMLIILLKVESKLWEPADTSLQVPTERGPAAAHPRGHAYGYSAEFTH